MAITALLFEVLANLVTNAASAQAHWPGWLNYLRIHSWLSLGIIAVVLVGLTLWGAPPQKPKKRNLRKVADDLADAVRAQWEYEAEWRRIFNPYALPVRWSAADADLFISWSTLVKQAEGSPSESGRKALTRAAGPQELAGEANAIADVLDRVPTRRLVVLGEPGAGKTILLVRLVLELVSPNRRKKGDPVAVLLPIASWNPAAEDLHSWIVHWLATDPAGLARFTSDSVSVARELLNAGLILPVLDGFDEIPDKVRGSALAKMNFAIRPCPGVVLASRTEAYRAAVYGEDGYSTLLTGAAGIKVCPLDANTVGRYLQDAADGPVISARWRPVIDTFSMDEPSPAAQALTTPLMVTLARAIYNPRDNEDAEAVQHQPGELLSPALFPTKSAIQDFLFDKFIWAAYRPLPSGSSAVRRHQWTYEQARKWLVFLARNQEDRESGTPDIAWWRLSRAAPSSLVAITLALTLAVVAAIGYPFVGLGVGIVAGLLVGILVRKLHAAEKLGITRGLVGGLIGGVASGLIALATLPAGPHNYGLGAYLAGGLGVGIAVAPLGDYAASLAGGLSGGITVSFYENAIAFNSIRTWVGAGSHLLNGIGIAFAAIVTINLASRREAPAHRLRWSYMWMLCGMGCGLVIGFIAWVQLGRTAGLLIGIVATVAGAMTGGIAEAVESDLTRAAAPGVVFRHDRSTFLGSWLVFGAALGLITGVAGGLSPSLTGHRNGLQFGIEVGLSNLIIPGLGLAFIQALWGTFNIARFWLAFRGQVPWRLMTFLQDAHMNRGVLRQAGASYQFRHIDLQRRIASWPEKSIMGNTLIVGQPEELPLGPGEDGNGGASATGEKLG